MAEYKTYSEGASHPLFAEFVKNTLGLDDVNQVAVLDQNALFYAFRRKIGDPVNSLLQKGEFSFILYRGQ